jgi:hypothetical protein
MYHIERSRYKNGVLNLDLQPGLDQGTGQPGNCLGHQTIKGSKTSLE